MSEIYFIRHGQASFGETNYDKLSDLGRTQALILGDFFIKTGVEFQAVYSGSMERQVGTVEGVLSQLAENDLVDGLKIMQEFNEYDSSAVVLSLLPKMIEEDPSVSEDVDKMISDRKVFQKIFGKIMMRWISGKYDDSKIETWRDFTGRVQQGVKRIMDECGPKKRVALFTSGGPISAVMQMALSLSDSETLDINWQIRNTSVSVFRYHKHNFGLLSFNNVAHLELKNESGLVTYR